MKCIWISIFLRYIFIQTLFAGKREEGRFKVWADQARDDKRCAIGMSTLGAYWKFHIVITRNPLLWMHVSQKCASSKNSSLTFFSVDKAFPRHQTFYSPSFFPFWLVYSHFGFVSLPRTRKEEPCDYFSRLRKRDGKLNYQSISKLRMNSEAP